MAVAARLNVFVDVDDDVVVCLYVGDTGIMVCSHDVTFGGNAVGKELRCVVFFVVI